MADAGTILPNHGTSAVIWFGSGVNYSTIDVANRRVLVTYYCKLQKQANNSAGPWGTAANFVFVLNGSTIASGARAYDFRSPNNYQYADSAVVSGSVWITYPLNGVFGNLTFSGSFTDGAGGALGNGSFSGSLAMPRIDRPIWVVDPATEAYRKAIVWVKNSSDVWQKTLPFINDSLTWKNPS